MTTSRKMLWVEIFVLAILVFLPFFMPSGEVLSLASLIATTAVATISYNVLLGQTGLLSFGHALYIGLGAFGVAQITRAAGNLGWEWFSLAYIPLFGGFLALAVAAVVGILNVRRAGVVFSMITLGFAEMVHSYALMESGFFGGDEGVSFDRVVGSGFLGFDFGPQIQVYGLIVIWLVIVLILMCGFRASVLGDLCRAVRDNETRVAFLGFSAERIRYLAFCFSAFIAGIAGGLMAISFEVVSAQILSFEQSGAVLIAAYIGGASSVLGSVIGAVVFVMFNSVLSTVTEAWPFHLGVVFIACVLFVPEGLAGALRQAPSRLREHIREEGIPVVMLQTFATLSAIVAYGSIIEIVYALSSGSPAPFRLLPVTALVVMIMSIGCVLYIKRFRSLYRVTEPARLVVKDAAP